MAVRAVHPSFKLVTMLLKISLIDWDQGSDFVAYLAQYSTTFCFDVMYFISTLALQPDNWIEL